MSQYRTHTCGQLRLEHAGETVTLSGWMENLREVGSNFAFLVLRDFYGVTQVVLETEEMVSKVKALNKESTLSVTGVVRERSSKNPKLDTGDIEVVPSEISKLFLTPEKDLEDKKISDIASKALATSSI